MMTVKDITVSYKWLLDDIVEVSVMNSAYHSKMAALQGDNTFTQLRITTDDIDFIKGAITRALSDIEILFGTTMLSADVGCDSDGCFVVVTMPAKRDIVESEIAVLDSLVMQYIVETILREWAAVTANSALLTKSGQTLEALSMSINNSLVWLISAKSKCSYSITVS